ncbi:MAG: UvrD-helicase domain-containing protein [Myxococcales bacterium]|nr:UvrD-helicase domain-containing protein [Myxococcales bacterium]
MSDEARGPEGGARRALFLFERNAVVRAGAGTGKTEALATVYLHLVCGLASEETWPRGGVAPERMVALTFTEKSAREMRDRIAEAVDLLANQRLPAQLEDADPALRHEAALGWCAQRGFSAAVAARVEALAASAVAQGRSLPPPELWQRVAWTLATAQIGTFHSFAAGVLRRGAVDLGLDPAFTVLDDEDSEQLLRGAVLRALSDMAEQDVAQVVELMAAAGGIGERAERGLVTRLSALVRKLEDDGLEAAAVELGPAVEASGVQPYIVADVLRRFADAADRVEALHSDGTSEAIYRSARLVERLSAAHDPVTDLQRLRALSSLPSLPPKTRTRRVEPLATEAREALAALERDAIAAVSAHLARAGRNVLARAQRHYREAKRRRSALDFADLLRHLRDALRDRPQFRRLLKARYDAVLVDEFQDTNRVQRDILYLLRERRDHERTVAPGQSLGPWELEPAGLLVVGDAKQSIYAFRGAEVDVFLSTERELSSAGGDAIDLTESHRAVGGVLAVVNAVSARLLAGAQVHARGLYDPARDALVARARGDETVRVELLTVPPGTADLQRGAEAEAIAARIAALAAGEIMAQHGTWRAPRMDEIAILVPSWQHLDPIKRALQARRIPYALRGGPGFWDRREVDDLVTLLRFVADPSDRLSLASVLRGPLVCLSDAALARLFTGSPGMEQVLDPPLAVRRALDPADRDRLEEARPTLLRLVQLGPTLGPSGVLRLALSERNYAAVLARLSFGAQRVANVDKLVGLAEAAQDRGGDDGDLPGFVRHVDRMRAAAQRESEADVGGEVSGAVQVMSIHAAKGLEWPVVFVAQSSRRKPVRTERIVRDDRGRLVILPGGVEAPEAFKQLRNQAHAAEDDDAQRLLYVALTRARDVLVVSGPDGPGDGSWGALRDAMLRVGPERVRVLAPGAEGPRLSVRARVERGDDLGDANMSHDVPVLASAAPPVRRQLTVLGAQDLAWCGRRFHLVHDLGLEDAPSAGAERALALGLLRRVLPMIGWTALVDAPARALRRALGALAAPATGRVAGVALAMLEGLAASALARRLAESPGSVLATMTPFAVRVLSPEGRAATLHGVADLVLRGSVVDADGVAVVGFTTASVGELLSGRGGVPVSDRALALRLAERAVGGRVAGADGRAVPVGSALWALGEGSAGDPLRLPDDGVDPLARAGALIDRLEEMQARGLWEPRDRNVCNSLRCGFVSRCHGR